MINAIKGRMNRATFFAALGLIIVILSTIVAFGKNPPGVLEVLIVYIGVPRLHDFGRSGWWISSLFVFEIAAIVLSLVYLPREDIEIAGGFIVLPMLAAMMALGCVKGDAGANDFGDPVHGLFGRGSK